MSALFTETTLNGMPLGNRLVMAAMTRNRATMDGRPTPMMTDYYRQRATAGLIISEAIQPTAASQGYPRTPGLTDRADQVGWQTVTDAVHIEGGRIIAQLMHAGRISHPTTLRGGTPVAPSAVRPAGSIFTGQGMAEFTTPRELSIPEIRRIVVEHVEAAQRAMDAGFDGVEVHGHSGFLAHSFLASNTNLRTDEYGGSIAGRVRFVQELVGAIGEAVGPERVGLRIGPGSTLNDIIETDTVDVYQALIAGLPRSLGYLSVLTAELDSPALKMIHEVWNGPLMINAEGNAARSAVEIVDVAQQCVERGADLVVLGAPFLANPDLVRRLELEAPLNAPRPEHFYGGTEIGYTDYPTLNTP